MATNPWEMDWSQGPVYGAPDPGEARAQAGEIRAQQDQALQFRSAERADATAERVAQNDAARIGIEQERLRLAQEAAARDAEKARLGNAGANAKRATMDSLVEQINRVTDLYNNGISQEGAANLWGALDAIGPQAAQFNSAGQGVADQALSAFRVPGVGAQSDLEARQFASANTPQAGDWDAAIEEKLYNLRRRVDANREAMGLPPAQWNELNPGLEVNVSDDSAPLASGGSGGAPDGPPSDPGGRSDVSTLARQGITLGLSDEAAGVGGYLSGFLTGEDPSSAYVRERDAERARVAGARERSPVLGTLAEFMGGGGAARIAQAPNALSGVIRQGAALGGIGGLGYGEGSESIPNAFAGAALGGGIGGALYGVGRGVSALAARRNGPAPTPEQVDLVAAGERQGIPLRQPDVRPEMRNRMANVETTQTGGPIIRQARASDAERIEQRVGEIGGEGSVSDPFALGTQVRAAGDRYIARTREQANRLYDRARQEAGASTVQPTEAIATIDQNIAELRAAGENSNAGQISYLEGLRSDLDRPLSIEAVQNLRSNMRGQIGERGLTGTDAERRVAQVIEAANRDLTRELPQNASNALRAADTFYRERQTFINDTLQGLMGSRGNPASAETVANRLVSMTRGGGNYRRFSSMWGQLEPAEQADVAATVAEGLGRKRNGDFSVSTLVQSLDPAKGINPRTARLIFGEDGANALRDLRAIASAKTETQAAMNNSRTGTAVNAAAGGLKGLVLSGLGFSQGGLAGGVAAPVIGNLISSIGERRTAQLLLNPNFTRWLRNAPDTRNPAAIDRYFSRLSGSIAANDNDAIRRAFMDSFRQSPGRAAASEEEREDIGSEPVGQRQR